MVCGPQSGRGAFQRRALEREFYLCGSESSICVGARVTFTQANPKLTHPTPSAKQSAVLFVCSRSHALRGNANGTLRVPHVQITQLFIFCSGIVLVPTLRVGTRTLYAWSESKGSIPSLIIPERLFFLYTHFEISIIPGSPK